MDDSNTSNALDIFLGNHEEEESYHSQYGDDGLSRNKGVTLSYNKIAQSDPLFVWFAAATLGSNQVGKSINLADTIVLNNCQSTQTISLGFSYGNQEIHNNIVALYHTYKDLGIEGLKQLTELDDAESYISPNAYKPFKLFSQLENEAIKYVTQINPSSTDQQVIAHILNNPKSAQELKEISMLLVGHEQSIVGPMYTKQYFENGKTVGEVINDICFIEKLIANGLGISGAEILDKYISVDGYDFNLFKDRMSYFGKVFDEYINVLAQRDGFDKLSDQRASIISSLNSEYIAYGEHFHEQYNISQVDNLEQLNSNLAPVSVVFDEHNDPNIFPALFSGEHEIVKISVNPLDYFLATNPNYEVIAHDITELWNSGSYHRMPIDGGTIFWNPNLPYLGNSAYLVLYTDGIYQYYQPYGEVRGIAFPFIYDKTTGIPLTMPIVDTFGHYSNASTIDTIYNNPELFNTPSHPNWYNPYWNQMVYQTRVESFNHSIKSMISDSYIASIAPINTLHYNSSNTQLELKIGDIFHDHSGNIDFSHLNGAGSNIGGTPYNLAITSMEIANGTLLEVNHQGNFVCANCNYYAAAQLENAANLIINYI